MNGIAKKKNAKRVLYFTECHLLGKTNAQPRNSRRLLPLYSIAQCMRPAGKSSLLKTCLGARMRQIIQNHVVSTRDPHDIEVAVREGTTTRHALPTTSYSMIGILLGAYQFPTNDPGSSLHPQISAAIHDNTSSVGHTGVAKQRGGMRFSTNPAHVGKHSAGTFHLSHTQVKT